MARNEVLLSDGLGTEVTSEDIKKIGKQVAQDSSETLIKLMTLVALHHGFAQLADDLAMAAISWAASEKNGPRFEAAMELGRNLQRSADIWRSRR